MLSQPSLPIGTGNNIYIFLRGGASEKFKNHPLFVWAKIIQYQKPNLSHESGPLIEMVFSPVSYVLCSAIAGEGAAGTGLCEHAFSLLLAVER